MTTKREVKLTPRGKKASYIMGCASIILMLISMILCACADNAPGEMFTSIMVKAFALAAMSAGILILHNKMFRE